MEKKIGTDKKVTVLRFTSKKNPLNTDLFLSFSSYIEPSGLFSSLRLFQNYFLSYFFFYYTI